MARTGIYKSDVRKARDVLLAEGKHPSIDAIRVILGNTGSKTTIHRYLRELEDEDGGAGSGKLVVSEVIQDLVVRLAERLHAESLAEVELLRAHQQALVVEHEATVARLQVEAVQRQQALDGCRADLKAQEDRLNVLTDQYQQSQAALLASRQQSQVLQERLEERQQFIQSLEEKHQHARSALEHYRESVKVQREQELRRHDQQLQQAQMEIRTINQTLIVKQSELTNTYQDLAKLDAELALHKQQLSLAMQDQDQALIMRRAQQQRIDRLESMIESLNQQLRQATFDQSRLWSALQTAHRPAEVAEPLPDVLTLDLFQ